MPTIMTAPPPPRAHPADSDPNTEQALHRVRGDRQERPQLPVVRGLFPRHRVRGFTAQMTASATTARAIRQMTAEVPVAYGADQETAENAMLVVSELISNADRACGPDALLFVEVYATDTGIAVTVHDPRGDLLPTRSTAAMDSSEAESGRGLRLLDELAPGWTTACSPIGKQIRCHVRPLGAA